MPKTDWQWEEDGDHAGRGPTVLCWFLVALLGLMAGGLLWWSWS